MSCSVAVVGATGAVGREMLVELAPLADRVKMVPFASARSAGSELTFAGRRAEVQEFSLASLKGFDVILMSAGGDFSRTYARDLVAGGAVVIDNSSAWRMDSDSPLVVPGVNEQVLKEFTSGVIANPNCSTIQMCLTLEPLRQRFGIEAVQVVTYQSVSGSGQKGIDELAEQRQAAAEHRPLAARGYDHVIYDNVIPAIDRLDESGHCFEEVKMIQETRRILGLDDLSILATTARVPTMACHCEAVTVTLGCDVSRSEALAAFREQEGVILAPEDSYASLPYPDQIAGTREVHVGRVRLPLGLSKSRVVQYWNVADNLKVGAATNAVRILECLLAQT